MSVARELRPLRVTVSGAADLVVQLEPGALSVDLEPGGDRTPLEPASPGGALEGERQRDIAPAPVLLAASSADVAAGRTRFEVVVDGWRFVVAVEDARAAALRERAVRAAAAHGVHVRLAIRAQIPGRVTRVWVTPGEQVEAGQRLLAIEAMKMENELRAPRAGTVEAVLVAEGDRVELNDELLGIV